MSNLSGLTADMCVKCNICTAACPVAAVTDLFPGPKAVGPQEERFRHPRLPSVDQSVAWCSGCGVCSRVCPHGVAVTEINVRAKAVLARQQGVRLRDHLISRPALLGRLAVRMAPLANAALGSSFARRVMETTLGISRLAPLPAFSRRSFRRRHPERIAAKPSEVKSKDKLDVAYFHGCSTEYYEPWIGDLSIAVLERLDCHVILPPQGCCGLPLQSNGLFATARRYGHSNVESLAPFAAASVPIVGTSTSCTLALKHEYHAILDLEGDPVDRVAGAVFDFFEFLTLYRTAELERQDLRPIPKRVLYHPPCQLRGHGIGAPALEVLRMIPELEVIHSDAECCGIAGTYGLKREKAAVAYDVGRTLFDQARDTHADLIACDSETCRWWIQKHTGVKSLHPLQLLAQAMNIE
jgi:glycerol-3-phosphate dehydrogenase subunit C